MRPRLGPSFQVLAGSGADPFKGTLTHFPGSVSAPAPREQGEHVNVTPGVAQLMKLGPPSCLSPSSPQESVFLLVLVTLTRGNQELSHLVLPSLI